MFIPIVFDVLTDESDLESKSPICVPLYAIRTTEFCGAIQGLPPHKKTEVKKWKIWNGTASYSMFKNT